MKKQYIKPTIQAVLLQQQHIICGSPDGYAKSVNNSSEGISWNDSGFDDNDDDY
ncbi:hypothetical protein L6470_06535 [Prevotella communis]|uniref:hypothetical protein n=1 Tax=Prevotella communis TaxID=2913614 RepID=UPI001EDAD232|nr:hypothetical protein [Prevotella communis]UKK60646.1 hypothetical protein L6470_06535 [Prevotella communis]